MGTLEEKLEKLQQVLDTILRLTEELAFVFAARQPGQRLH
jgi:hypothetical protein